MPEQKKTFSPTPQMQRVLAAMQEHGYDCTVTAACGAAEVDRRTYYKWCAREEFVVWWLAQQEAYFTLATGRVQAATLKAATSEDAPGTTSDRKLFLERFDPYYAKRAKLPASATKSFEQELADIEAARQRKPARKRRRTSQATT